LHKTIYPMIPTLAVLHYIIISQKIFVLRNSGRYFIILSKSLFFSNCSM